MLTDDITRKLRRLHNADTGVLFPCNARWDRRASAARCAAPCTEQRDAYSPDIQLSGSAYRAAARRFGAQPPKAALSAEMSAHTPVEYVRYLLSGDYLA